MLTYGCSPTLHKSEGLVKEVLYCHTIKWYFQHHCARGKERKLTYVADHNTLQVIHLHLSLSETI